VLNFVHHKVPITLVHWNFADFKVLQEALALPVVEIKRLYSLEG
jgi:hypothetical protein